jgi:hypothetical protein
MVKSSPICFIRRRKMPEFKTPKFQLDQRVRIAHVLVRGGGKTYRDAVLGKTGVIVGIEEWEQGVLPGKYRVKLDDYDALYIETVKQELEVVDAS